MLGRYGEAEHWAQRGRQLGDADDVWTQMLWRQVQALVLANRGAFEEAERLAQEAVALAAGTDGLNDQGHALCDLATVLERAGRIEEAGAVLEEALERYERKHNRAMVGHVQQRLAATEGQVRSV
jgi:tetratricopeptide (TPR) repeat protein